MFDVAVIGAGPSGLAAAITLACEGKTVVLLEKSDSVGGQIAHSHLVENVAGYRNGFNGEDFALQSYEQATGLGVTILLGHQVMRLWHGAVGFGLSYWQSSDGAVGNLYARSILITVGVAPRPLPFDVLKDPDCHGCKATSELQLQPANPGEHVLVYGGGNSAGQAAVYYARRGCIVTLLSRRSVQQTMDARWITTLGGLGVYNVVGEIDCVLNDSVVFESSGVTQHLTPHTLHAFTGGEPTTTWLQGWVELDSQGYIVTDAHHCTATYGIFAAGDCVSGSVKKFTCAVGGGCEAVPAIGQYLSNLPLDAAMRSVI